MLLFAGFLTKRGGRKMPWEIVQKDIGVTSLNVLSPKRRGKGKRKIILFSIGGFFQKIPLVVVETPPKEVKKHKVCGKVGGDYYFFHELCGGGVGLSVYKQT